jgi:hypothetical protein
MFLKWGNCQIFWHFKFPKCQVILALVNISNKDDHLSSKINFRCRFNEQDLENYMNHFKKLDSPMLFKEHWPSSSKWCKQARWKLVL